MKNSLVTVIVPVYNSFFCLEKCVNSILNQTFADFELILIDDGSDDGSFNLCDHLASFDRRIRVIHQDNHGVSKARNVGLASAKGEYVVFVDSDDYVTNTYLENLISNHGDLIISKLRVTDENNNILYIDTFQPACYWHKTDIDYLGLCKQDSLFGPCCKLFKREIIQKNSISFNEQYKWGEDGMFVFEYLSHVDSLILIDKVDYYYIKKKDDKSLTTQLRLDIIDEITNSRTYCQYIVEQCIGKSSELREIFSRKICNYCSHYIIQIFHNPYTIGEKLKYLSCFINKEYVKLCIENKELYFEKFPSVKFALSQKNPVYMLIAFYINKYYRRLQKFFT